MKILRYAGCVVVFVGSLHLLNTFKPAITNELINSSIEQYHPVSRFSSIAEQRQQAFSEGQGRQGVDAAGTRKLAILFSILSFITFGVAAFACFGRVDIKFLKNIPFKWLKQYTLIFLIATFSSLSGL